MKGLKKPLLIVAYTNHALDQFLNHILKFTNNIARIGGRCNDETIKKYTLAELRKLEKFPIRHFRELRYTIENLLEIKNFLFQLSPLNFSQFFNNLPEEHKKTRMNDLADILEDYGYNFMNPISHKTLDQLFKLWRDGVIVNKKFLKPIVDFEINQMKVLS